MPPPCPPVCASSTSPATRPTPPPSAPPWPSFELPRPERMEFKLSDGCNQHRCSDVEPDYFAWDMNSIRDDQPAWLWGAGAVLLGAGGAFVAYLLARFPYDGLYGQDSYAYYYQALAFWQELTGQASFPGQPFTTSGLYHWPIGYHLHLLLGFLIAGVRPAGGRALTLGMTVATPV